MNCYVSAQIAQHAEDLGFADSRSEYVETLASEMYSDMTADPGWLLESIGDAIGEIDIALRNPDCESMRARVVRFFGHCDAKQLANDYCYKSDAFWASVRKMAADYMWRRAYEKADDAVPDEPMSRRQRDAMLKLESLP